MLITFLDFFFLIFPIFWQTGRTGNQSSDRFNHQYGSENIGLNKAFDRKMGMLRQALVLREIITDRSQLNLKTSYNRLTKNSKLVNLKQEITLKQVAAKDPIITSGPDNIKV